MLGRRGEKLLHYKQLTPDICRDYVVKVEPCPWIKPSPGSYKLNIDASYYRQKSQAGVAGILRDCHGDPKMQFGENVLKEIDNNPEAELYALQVGLRRLLEKASRDNTPDLVKKTMIESDSWEVYQTVGKLKKNKLFGLTSATNYMASKPKSDWTDKDDVIYGIILLMSPDVHFHHVVREQNVVAGKLAAKARSNLRLGESRVYEEDDTEHMDAENLSLIQDDRVGNINDENRRVVSPKLVDLSYLTISKWQT